MVTEHQAYFLKTIEIPCEQDNINFNAQEMGFFHSLLENETDDTKRQWFRFFEAIAETELDNAAEKLTKYREQLNDFDQQQRQLRLV